MEKLLVHLFALVLGCSLVSGSGAASPPGTRSEIDAGRAQALLARAVEHYRSTGDAAFAEFGRQGRYIDKELYVYVLDTDGTMLTSGGASASLIGRNVSAMRDATGKPFFAEILEIAKTRGSGQVEYRWLNWVDNTLQRKQAFFQRAGERILAVGYYLPRSSPAQARAFLDQAVASLKAAPEEAVKEFNRLGGRFVQDDLYVFVIDMKSGHFIAHGAQPRLIGTDGLELKDASGQPIIRNILAMAQTRKLGELDYQWPNPVTKRTEQKRTLFQVVGPYIVAVGYYNQ
ncbi:cache domain-containing protein [Zoogloea sp. LCSB751]|uniref:cache domain-containing protein n=1 Tax=Zoogloea sp. LCSB751 TaxID=1965277 RepID=UPI0009A4E7C2|nr:cache domain-containing protein [Zoogloea sp. LCSB751]